MNPSTAQDKMIKSYFEARIKNKQEYYIHPPYQMEQKLVHAIRKGLHPEAIAALDAINGLKRATLAKDQIRSLKNSMIGSCTIFTRAIIDGGVRPEHAFSLSDVYIMQIEETNEIEALNRLEYDMVHSFIKTLIQEKKPSYNLIINKTISFIHDEIMNSLSLKQIAAHVKVHPIYLSKLFKQQVGLTITEFIARERIEESKYLLLHSSMKISDISIFFDFCNQSYYTRLFRKYTKMTPLQFRDKYGNHAADGYLGE